MYSEMGEALKEIYAPEEFTSRSEVAREALEKIKVE
jgi:Arc/MetJ-type ribon-helix-helix transcriptional regulator